MESPESYLEKAIKDASSEEISRRVLEELPDDYIVDLRTIISGAETLKGVLGVTLTSIVYKCLYPSQDIRRHQDGMTKGYSGRTFDTKYTTPFLKKHFSHFAMAESSWLTRSLEQPHPYVLKYPGKIRDTAVKAAFLNTLDRVQSTPQIAPKMLVGILSLMIEMRQKISSLAADIHIPEGLPIIKITEAIRQHYSFNYAKGVYGAARIPVLSIYAVYQLLLHDVKRYAGKILVPLESHTSCDLSSKSLGDIEVKNKNGDCFEAVEIKHGKPVTSGMIDDVYQKIKSSPIDRYYILTTCEPNCTDYDSIAAALSEYRRRHPCQIIVNGVLPSLKYYLRLVSDPTMFIETYSHLLCQEYSRGSAIKNQHIEVWKHIQNEFLKCANS